MAEEDLGGGGVQLENIFIMTIIVIIIIIITFILRSDLHIKNIFKNSPQLWCNTPDLIVFSPSINYTHVILLTSMETAGVPAVSSWSIT